MQKPLTELITKLKANQERIYKLDGTTISKADLSPNLQEELNNAFFHNDNITVLALESVDSETVSYLANAINTNHKMYSLSLARMKADACYTILKKLPNNIQFIEIQNLDTNAVIQVFKIIQLNKNVTHINILNSELEMVTTSLTELKQCPYIHTVRLFKFPALKSSAITTLLNNNQYVKTVCIDILFPASEIEVLKMGLRADIGIKRQLRGQTEVLRSAQTIQQTEQNVIATINNAQVSGSYTSIKENILKQKVLEEREKHFNLSSATITKHSPSPQRVESRDERNTYSRHEKPHNNSRDNFSSRESSLSPDPKKYSKPSSPEPRYQNSPNPQDKNWDRWRPESRSQAILSPSKSNEDVPRHGRSYEKYPTTDKQDRSSDRMSPQEVSRSTPPKKIDPKPISKNDSPDREKTTSSMEKHSSENTLKRKLETSMTSTTQSLLNTDMENHIDKKKKQSIHAKTNGNTTPVATIDLSKDDSQKSSENVVLQTINSQSQMLNLNLAELTDSSETNVSSSLPANENRIEIDFNTPLSLPIQNVLTQIPSDQQMEETQNTATIQTQDNHAMTTTQPSMSTATLANTDVQATTQDLNAVLKKMALELIEATTHNTCRERENKYLREVNANLLSLLEIAADTLPQSIHGYVNLPDNLSLFNAANFSDSLVTVAKTLPSSTQKTKDNIPSYLKNHMLLCKQKEQASKNKTEITEMSLFSEEQKKFLQSMM